MDTWLSPKAIDSVDDLNSRHPALQPHEACNQSGACPRVCCLACGPHVLERLHCFIGIAIVDASSNETGPDLGVGREPAFLWQGVHSCEGLVQLLEASVELHEDAQGKVRWNDLVVVHALQNDIHKVCTLVLGAAIQDSVVDNGIVVDMSILHSMQNFHSLVQLPLHCVAFHNRGVRDRIWWAAFLCHVLHNLRDFIHVAQTSLCIYNGVVSHRVHLHALADHVTPKSHCTFRLLHGGQAFHKNGADHSVGFQLGVGEQGDGVVHPVVDHQGI
mmetsp:Transcript_13147/g.23256  ORF Transcript_13147/g.23256 Transcript_13147/m.23256 type:complete len:273 (-) Transcript_13147:851-1669(-)